MTHYLLSWTPLKYINELHKISAVHAHIMKPMQGISKGKDSQWPFSTLPSQGSSWEVAMGLRLCTMGIAIALCTVIPNFSEKQLMDLLNSHWRDKLMDTLLPIFFVLLFWFQKLRPDRLLIKVGQVIHIKHNNKPINRKLYSIQALSD